MISTEVVVLGSGPAGYVCAIRLAQLGKKVTVVDRAEIGGVCLNRGCIPSKALIHAGTTFEKANHAADIGIEIKGASVNLPKLMTWKESVVKKLTTGVSGLLKANGCQVVAGDAKFTSATSMEVKTAGGTETIQFKQCVIATGSRPSTLPGFTVDQKKIWDSTGALSQQTLPEKLLCIGGGYIGLELGTFYAKVGTQVTVVEAGPGLLGGVDPELTRVVARNLTKRGVNVQTSTFVKGCKVTAKGVDVTVAEGSPTGTEKTISVDAVLVTIGRTPNSDGLGLEKTGVKLDSKGFILVDAQRRTNVPNLYAIGDIAGQPLLAHKGSKEGLVAAEAIAGKKVAYEVQAMPAVIFTDPEIATVGLTEAEAKAKGYNAQIGQFPFVANGRALSVADSDGMVKMIGDAKSGRLLGVHIVGPEASNLISEAALAIEMGARVEDLALTVHPHPTLPEAMMEAAEATLGHAIHIFQKKATSPGATARV
ncbi:MAG: dihydrolipoyl dehydrogenase [Bdellovibrionales bacterium]|nr:dihydrolipoyl dehydrogenase [Bdellovibrionales bacterium]